MGISVPALQQAEGPYKPDATKELGRNGSQPVTAAQLGKPEVAALGESLLAIKDWNKVHGGEPQGLCTADISKRVQTAPSHSASKTEVKEEKGPLAAEKGN